MTLSEYLKRNQRETARCQRCGAELRAEDEPGTCPSEFGGYECCACSERRREERIGRLLEASEIPWRCRRYSFGLALAQEASESAPSFRARVRGTSGAVGVSCQNQRLVEYLMEYSRHRSRPWLWLSGRCGSGKTLFLSCLARSLIEQEIQVVYLSSLQMWGQVRGEEKSMTTPGGTLYRALHASVLVLDDMNPTMGEPPQPWMKLAMQAVIGHRYDAQLPTLIGSRGLIVDWARVWASSFDDMDWLSGRIQESCEHVDLSLEAMDWREEE